MRLAFSSLRESSCWLPAVIQLLVRKHSQDARRQRAIALKSLAVGFVVRENAFRYLPFFRFPFAECIFDRALTAKKRPMESQFAVLLSRSLRADHTSFMANDKRRGEKIIEKESEPDTSEENVFLFGSLSDRREVKRLNFVKLHNRSHTHEFICRFNCRCNCYKNADLESRIFETRLVSFPYLSLI